MDKSTTESIVAKILEDLLNDLPIENQEDEEYLEETIESQPSDDSDEDMSGSFLVPSFFTRFFGKFLRSHKQTKNF